MINSLIELDSELLLAVNGWNSSFADPIMCFVTNKWSAAPIYAVTSFLIFFKRNLKLAIFMFLAVNLTFALTDRLSVLLFKDVFERYRPCWDPALQDTVRLLEHRGGKFGFISNHAANFFGFAVISSCLLRKRWYTFTIFGWATAVAYSRVYVGKHFPGDVICGALFGMAIGFLVLQLFRWLVIKYRFRKCYVS